MLLRQNRRQGTSVGQRVTSLQQFVRQVNGAVGAQCQGLSQSFLDPCRTEAEHDKLGALLPAGHLRFGKQKRLLQRTQVTTGDHPVQIAVVDPPSGVRDAQLRIRIRYLFDADADPQPFLPRHYWRHALPGARA